MREAISAIGDRVEELRRSYRKMGTREKLAMARKLSAETGIDTDTCHSILVAGIEATFLTREQAVLPPTLGELMSARKKPTGTSDARWRMELARRKSSLSVNRVDTTPERTVSGPFLTV